MYLLTMHLLKLLYGAIGLLADRACLFHQVDCMVCSNDSYEKLTQEILLIRHYNNILFLRPMLHQKKILHQLPIF